MEEIYNYIRNIGCFMIFSSVVRLLIPQNSFRDYVNLFLGLIFTVVMLNPLSTFIKTDLPRLEDYVIKNGASVGAELFGADSEKSRDIVTDEYEKTFEKRISELCKGYIDGAETEVEIDEYFDISAVYIKGKASKDTSELKRLISGLCGIGEENIIFGE
ncbi:MAG: stage III sporulation protein AF [Clostridiales bacterium]|nr:stage III sporulation protein AF [Clostridiales bacterium]